jgi:hypothetical protein
MKVLSQDPQSDRSQLMHLREQHLAKSFGARLCSGDLQQENRIESGTLEVQCSTRLTWGMERRGKRYRGDGRCGTCGAHPDDMHKTTLRLIRCTPALILHIPQNLAPSRVSRTNPRNRRTWQTRTMRMRVSRKQMLSLLRTERARLGRCTRIKSKC